jgi:hypothetical protein
MKTILGGLLATMAILAPATASADPAGTVQVPLITIYGRPAHPAVTIVLTRPTAAREAGIAHEAVRQSLMKQSMPPALKTP